VTLSDAAQSRWAYVLSPAAARERPSATSRLVTIIGSVTPEGGPNLVLALASREDSYGRTWIRVRLAILPDNSTGWVRRSRLGPLHLVRTHLIIDRAALTAVLWRAGHPIFTARIGVGKLSTPTPAGVSYVREKLTGFHDPFYGPVAFGTSARSPVLTDWPGRGYIGIHGTDTPQILPGRVSHGCIRLRNADILRLARLLPLGTPVTVR
jgi:hypothetical protein